MIDISTFDFNQTYRLKYIDATKIQDIPLIFIEYINRNLYMNYDYLMIKHYGKEGEKYLKLILMFNNLNDISDIKIGDYLRIPSLSHLLSQLELIDENVNGIYDFNQNNLVENVTNKVPKLSKDRRKTTANPRLNITLERPKFENGVIKY